MGREEGREREEEELEEDHCSLYDALGDYVFVVCDYSVDHDQCMHMHVYTYNETCVLLSRL
jgi:hypothetical protein